MTRQARFSSLFALLVLCAGLGLRLWQPSLIEFKWDEAYMFAATQGSAGHTPFPALGMPSGAAGLLNPGLSIWIFSAPAQLFGLSSPEALSRYVGLSFIATLALLLVYITRSTWLRNDEKIAWFAAIALSAANPVLLLFTRKIWAQSLLPIFGIAIFVLWMERKKRPSLRILLAFLCVLIGQIHMSGFFLGAALMLVEVRDVFLKRATLGPLLVGGIVGCLPMIAWLQEIFVGSGASKINGALGMHRGAWPEFLKFRYWSYAASFGSGLNFSSSLGSHLAAFLERPLVLGALVCSAALVLTVLIASLRALAQSPRAWLRTIFSMSAFDEFRPSSQLVWIALVLCGALMTLSNVRIHRHYLILVTPLLAFAFARLAQRLFPRHALVGLSLYTILQLLVSFEMIRFLDLNHGAPGADFGVAYKYQSDFEKERLP
ncbi:MAG: hypothetical protein ABIR96_00160 [Bdellovibrionota bacterium]